MLDYRAAKVVQEEMLRRAKRSATTQSVSREEGKPKPAGLAELLRHGASTLFRVPRLRRS